jgi:hypothetical protein
MRIRSPITFVLVVFIASAAACGGGSSPGKPDAAVDAFNSTCGMPGDVGNEMGVGKFCAHLSDCDNPNAGLCSSLGDPTTHFCTHTCKSTDPQTVCGTAAQCTCNASNQCGCTPTKCLQ